MKNAYEKYKKNEKMNDEQFLRIMGELKFIGSVQEGQYLNVTSGRIENTNWFTKLVRSVQYPNENGITTARFCSSTITKAIALHEKYSEIAGCEEYVKMIKQYILTAKKSLEHLKKTHETNNLAYATFDFTIVTISQRLPE